MVSVTPREEKSRSPIFAYNGLFLRVSLAFFPSLLVPLRFDGCGCLGFLWLVGSKVSHTQLF